MRYLTPELLRLLREERKMAFIAGPRQVGKTTLVKRLLSDAGQGGNYFNWDIESHRKAILRNPERFWTDSPAAGERARLVLDEIHKYPRWKRFLKGLHDAAGAEADMLVTGSGRLDVYQRGGDSLFGRYALYRLHPFTLGEFLAAERPSPLDPERFWSELAQGSPPIGAEKALAEIDRLTGFPEPLFSGSESRLSRWRRSRRQLVIREDLRDLTRIREIGLIDAMVELLPERVGAPLSLNALSRDLSVAFGSVRLWIEALARLYYLFDIRPYAGRLARTLRREAKVYLFDFSEIENPGARFENLTALHLRKLCDAWNDWGFGEYKLWYVRDKEKRESDFLITRSMRPYVLLETKLSGEAISPALRYFHARLKPVHTAQIVRHLPGRGLLRDRDGILQIAASRFLSLI